MQRARRNINRTQIHTSQPLEDTTESPVSDLHELKFKDKWHQLALQKIHSRMWLMIFIVLALVLFGYVGYNNH